jgi:hypothetical protein
MTSQRGFGPELRVKPSGPRARGFSPQRATRGAVESAQRDCDAFHEEVPLRNGRVLRVRMIEGNAESATTDFIALTVGSVVKRSRTNAFSPGATILIPVPSLVDVAKALMALARESKKNRTKRGELRSS